MYCRSAPLSASKSDGGSVDGVVTEYATFDGGRLEFAGHPRSTYEELLLTARIQRYLFCSRDTGKLTSSTNTSSTAQRPHF